MQMAANPTEIPIWINENTWREWEEEYDNSRTQSIRENAKRNFVEASDAYCLFEAQLVSLTLLK